MVRKLGKNLELDDDIKHKYVISFGNLGIDFEQFSAHFKVNHNLLNESPILNYGGMIGILWFIT